VHLNYDLSGVIDLHTHTHPDIQPCLLDEIQAAEAVKSAGSKNCQCS
jgi:hypothetical protein